MLQTVVCVVFVIFFSSCRCRPASFDPPVIDIFSGGPDGDDIIMHRGPHYKTALRNRSYLWDEIRTADGRYVIPYYVNFTFAKKSHEKTVRAAMEHIANNTCVSFVALDKLGPEDRKKITSHVVIYNPRKGCGTEIGRYKKGEILLKLSYYSKGTCYTVPVVLHELLHIVGLKHEQSRADRDDYITIQWENIKKGHKHNFNKVDSKLYDNYNVPYDYNSIMHYKATIFSRNGKYTILTKDPKYQRKIGTAKVGSAGDYHKVCKFYRCKECMGSFNREVRKQYGWN